MWPPSSKSQFSPPAPPIVAQKLCLDHQTLFCFFPRLREIFYCSLLLCEDVPTRHCIRRSRRNDPTQLSVYSHYCLPPTEFSSASSFRRIHSTFIDIFLKFTVTTSKQWAAFSDTKERKDDNNHSAWKSSRCQQLARVESFLDQFKEGRMVIWVYLFSAGGSFRSHALCVGCILLHNKRIWERRNDHFGGWKCKKGMERPSHLHPFLLWSMSVSLSSCSHIIHTNLCRIMMDLWRRGFRIYLWIFLLRKKISGTREEWNTSYVRLFTQPPTNSMIVFLLSVFFINFSRIQLVQRSLAKMTTRQLGILCEEMTCFCLPIHSRGWSPH